MIKGDEPELKHITAIISKYIMVAVVLEIILKLMTSLSFGNILLISLAVTVIAYVIGDVFILPATNNIFAVIADFALALVTIYAFNFSLYRNMVSFWSALVAAAVLGIGEWFFHMFMKRLQD
jgi:hypothetical protein